MIQTIANYFKGRRIEPYLLLCFFVSGACGLIYEVTWLRILGLVFGNTTFATSTVLSSYMAGLGLGALFFGRWIDRKNVHPVWAYGCLEAGVAAYAVVTPLIWKLIEWIHIGFYRAFEPSFLTFSLFKFAVAFLALFVPTFLMGGTLPVISKFFVSQQEETAKKIGLLYALNTFGAVLGVFVCGFFLLYLLGMRETVWMTAFLNLLIFILCAAYYHNVKSAPLSIRAKAAVSAKHPPPAAAGIVESKFSPVSILLLFLFGVSGAVSMMYEVAWTRVLAIVLGSSVYAFSVMLATFLLGISAGSYLFSMLARRFKIDWGTFAFLQVLTAVFVFWGINPFEEMPYYFVKLFAWTKGSVGQMEFGKFLFCAAVMFPPTLCIGAMFACFVHVHQRGGSSIGTELGTVYFFNTIGTISGSALTGFLIIPAIGIQTTLVVAAGINAAIGVIVFLAAARPFNWKRVVVFSTVLGAAVFSGMQVHAWNRAVLTSGTAVHPEKTVGISKKDFFTIQREKQNLFYKEGTSATVSVDRVRDNISLSVNGKIDASVEDAFTQFMLGHLPMILHPDPKEILVIGLGSGSTMAAVASYPSAKIIHGVELEGAVVEAARYFSKLNRNVLDDPRVKMFINDGRNVVLVRPDQYDVIISEPSNPWMAGVANLFSLEHYHLMKSRLKPGGLVCQWLHAYSMSTQDLKMIMATFAKSYDYVQLWTSFYPDLMLIGSREPFEIDMETIRKRLEIPDVRKDLRKYGIRKPEGFFASYWLGHEELLRLSRGSRLNTDNRPYLEFSAPRNLYKDTLRQNFDFLNSERSGIFPEIKNLKPPVASNADFYNEIAKGYVSKRFFGEAQKALSASERLQPGNPGYLETSGIVYFKNEQMKEAEDYLTRAVAADPALVDARFFLGAVYRKKGALDQAIAEYQQTVTAVPDDLEFKRELADALFEAKRFGEAKKAYEEIITIRGDDFQAMSRIGDITFHTGELEDQIAISKVLMEKYPRFQVAYERMGKTLEDKGLLEPALRIYMSLVREFPEEARSYLHLATVYDRMGRPDDLKWALQMAVRFDDSLGTHPDVARVLKK